MRCWFHYTAVMFLFVTLSIVVVMLTPFIVSLTLLNALSKAIAEASGNALDSLCVVIAQGRRMLDDHFEELFELKRERRP